MDTGGPNHSFRQLGNLPNDRFPPIADTRPHYPLLLSAKHGGEMRSSVVILGLTVVLFGIAAALFAAFPVSPHSRPAAILFGSSALLTAYRAVKESRKTGA